MQRDPSTKKGIEKSGKVNPEPEDGKKFLRGILNDLQGIEKALK